MIVLKVVSFNGQAPQQPLSAHFDELGGTIGRADTNQLVLPDPDRSISRIHAQVVFRSGSYALIDRGSNPISVNQRPLGNGVEMPIKAGDHVDIGSYRLAVESAGAAGASGHAPGASTDPFADLLGPAATAPAAKGSAAGLVDPLALFGASAPGPAAAAPHGGGFGSGSGGFGSGSGGSNAGGGIPEDWDPFAPVDPAPARGGSAGAGHDLLGLGGGGAGGGQFGLDTGSAAAAPLLPEFGKPGNDGGGLDQLFGLGSVGADPLAGSILADPLSRPNMAGSHDPLRALGAAPVASGAASADTLSDLSSPFMSAPLRAAPAAPAAPAPQLPSGAVLSWQDQGGVEGHTLIRPAGPRNAAPPAAAAAPAPLQAPAAAPAMPAALPAAPLMPAAPPLAPPAAARATAAAPPASGAGAPAGAHADALLAAFKK
ncbi:MAG: FHA domain-containing protein, partial [Pseudomonadota bacterium]|nr:FHA domain-containing protein [Pseudomonadota bacterium]